LFPANSATLEDINKPKFLLANLTLSVESLVIFAILGIMVTLFSFSLGVERGKRFAAQALDERVSAAWNVRARTVAPAAILHPGVARPQAAPVTAVPVAKSMAAPRQVIQQRFSLGTGSRYTLQAATYGNEEYAR